MATKKQKEELMEILKFTPCTYKIEIYGYGGEIVMGRVDPKTVEFFKTNLISVPNYATSWADEGDDDYVEIPDELKPFPQGSWYDGDNIEHTSGAEFGGCTVRVSDENDNEVWEKDLSTELEDEGCEVDYSGDYDVDEYVTEDTAVFVGQSFEKGTFFSGDLELKAPFDPKKLKFTYTTVAGWDILTSVEYNGEELDGSGGYDSTGKSTEYKFYYLGDGEIEEYVEPSDEDYGVPAFGPSPSDWEKSPKFKFKKQKPTGVGWYNVNWGHGTTYGSLYWNGTNFVEFNYGKETIISDDSIVTWQGYNWDTSDWSNRPPEPPDVICNNKKCKQTGYSDKMERNDDYDLICPHCGKTDFDWIDYDPETAKGRKNRETYTPSVLDAELNKIAEEVPGFPTAAELNALEQVSCVQCDWKGSVEETFDKDGEMVCPECGEPVEFTNGEEESKITYGSWPFSTVEPFPASTTNEEKEDKTMATWTVRPYHKKSIEEVEHFSKDGVEVIHRTGWRWGEWTVTTNDGNPPEFEFDYVPGGDGNKDSIDMNSCYTNNIEEVEMIETSDGCWDDTEWPDDIDEDERNTVEEMMEEEGYYTAFEENGWFHDDTEMWIWGPIEILDENGNRVRIICADEDGNVVDFKDE